MSGDPNQDGEDESGRVPDSSMGFVPDLSDYVTQNAQNDGLRSVEKGDVSMAMFPDDLNRAIRHIIVFRTVKAKSRNGELYDRHPNRTELYMAMFDHGYASFSDRWQVQALRSRYRGILNDGSMIRVLNTRRWTLAGSTPAYQNGARFHVRLSIKQIAQLHDMTEDMQTSTGTMCAVLFAESIANAEEWFGPDSGVMWPYMENARKSVESFLAYTQDWVRLLDRESVKAQNGQNGKGDYRSGG